ncbi:MAG: SPOR domain-containing protein [Prevotella sp.]|nr:SPOR domain-containing protein [Prevotella sp.]
MKRTVIIIISCVLCTICAEAQTFTDRLQQQKAGKGTVTLHQSKEIDKLVNGRYSDPNAAGMRPDIKPEQPAKEQQAGQGNTVRQVSPVRHVGQVKQEKQNTDQQDIIPQDTTPDMSKKVMRKSYKTTGYRVQVWAGGNSRVDRQKAEKAGMTVKRNIPGVPVYVHFYSPRWICRIGNYRTYEEAHEVLREVKQLGYPEAVIVKGKITVQY